MKKLFLILAIILSNNTFACDCVEKPSIKENWTSSHDVYTAKIISVDSSHFTYSGNRLFLLNAEIIHHYKNQSYPGYEMRTFYFTEGGSCDFSFQVHKQYLIYESRLQNSVLSYASICSRTTLLSDVNPDELKELEELSKTGIKENDTKADFSIELSMKEYNDLQKQALNAQELSDNNKYLMILYGIILITSIVFIILYLKTKKKLRAFEKL